MNRETAIFAAGCFWGVEADFRDLPGVLDTEVGYTGGTTEQPTYREVCSDTTGHAEAVRVTFDADVVSYEALVDAFFSLHDPTQLNRQGPDIGTQYRSSVFFRDERQHAAAEASKARAQARSSRPIVTSIVPAQPFFRAEDYHQRYLEKQGLRSCRI
ncbi:MAG TPA: peptide-methionine (S)-S-oxide reductase MsrA [Candidatus Limnocylindria bacterium]|jgi:peptide-methionine (S)-S-oxide reductase|nr:peptide-methionine (S)-S-oxide reductase MsrA [Candidatus Limnocylindria bacterium]